MTEIYSFGTWIKQRRAHLRFTQRALAEQVFCSTAMIKKIEADERQPSVELAELLAQALQVPSMYRPVFRACARGEHPVDALPVIAQRFSGQEIAALRRLWARRDLQLACLAQQRQVLCHLDAYRSNFFWQGDPLTLIDWEFVGVGALGEEMAVFVGATLLLDHVPMTEAPQLEAVALDGYLAGLREAGWGGDADAVWQAYRCAMPLRYALGSLASIGRTVMQPDFAEHWSQQTGKPLEAILAQRAELLRFLLTRSC